MTRKSALWGRIAHWVRAVGDFITFGVNMSQKIDQVLEAVAELKQSVDTLTEAVTVEAGQAAALVAKIEELKAQVAAGQVATPEQLDVLLADVQDIQQKLQTASAAVAAIAPDAVA